MPKLPLCPTIKAGVAALPLLAAAAGAAAQTAALPTTDSSVFLQYGSYRSSHAYGLGATRDWPASWALGSLRLSGYWQGQVEYWHYPRLDDGTSDRTSLVKIEATPMFRLRGDGGTSPWFVDAGIGLTLTSHLYRTRTTSASTAFNFGDQVAVGWLFGPHEVALRYEHMSNASIKEPNPAINFYQLRYAYHFGF